MDDLSNLATAFLPLVLSRHADTITALPEENREAFMEGMECANRDIFINDQEAMTKAAVTSAVLSAFLGEDASIADVTEKDALLGGYLTVVADYRQTVGI